MTAERHGTRGRLRVLLGAAPGVGKTYEMLAEGKRLLDEGRDVVIAIVETHGRTATAAQTIGIPEVPRRTDLHRGVPLSEMDLDSVLARSPEIALVDELAHTNTPGSQNTKRWQDVNALLDAGIDVVTTVNVQHIESLNAVVEKITGIAQQETIPDAVAENLRRVRAATTARIMAVVKADGYGHGAVTVARAAVDAGAEWLGVTDVAEAVALRGAGITAVSYTHLTLPTTPYV